MYYFAYGSNMFSPRMQRRVPSADMGVRAYVAGYVLRFHKIGRKDNSGKCDAFHTGNPDDRLWGVLYKMDQSDKPSLDRAEGLGYGYDIKDVAVTTDEGGTEDAYMYTADAASIDPDLPALDWYVKFVLDGALEHNLPQDYILSRISAAFPFKEP